MYFDFLVKIPKDTGRVTINRRGDTTYIEYTYDRVYHPEKKYSVPKRTTIGKQSPTDPTMMLPNPNFLKFFPDTELPEPLNREKRSSCLRIGTFLIIQKIIKEYKLDEILFRLFGKDSGLFLDLASYSIIAENNAAQYYPDYAYNHPLMTEGMKVYSDAKISDFLHQITIGQSTSFLNTWNEAGDHRERIYISCDSTNKGCQAGDIEVTESGHAKDGQGKPVFNYSIAYDRNNREPLFYEEYPGSIVDVSQLQYMLEKAKGYGYKKVGFILDRGYFSRENIHFMDKCGYDFVIMMKGMKKLVSRLVLENKGSFEEKRSHSIREYQVSGITVKKQIFPSDEEERYFHIYYSSRRYAAERELVEAKIDRMARYLKAQMGKQIEISNSFQQYFDLIYYHEGQEDQTFVAGREREDVINCEIQLCGYFVIITSRKMTAKEALLLYKSRDGSEKLFRGDKSYLGNRSMRVQSDESMEAKIFIEFVALIIRNRIYTCLKDEMLETDSHANYMTVPAAIKELEKIELVRQADQVYRLDHAVTRTQKSILKAFGLDSTFIKKEAVKLSKQLSEDK